MDGSQFGGTATTDNNIDSASIAVSLLTTVVSINIPGSKRSAAVNVARLTRPNYNVAALAM